VVINDVCLQSAELIKEEITAATVVEEIEAIGQRALGVEADVTDRAAVDRMVGLALEKFGHIDVLVNNAGSAKPIPDTPQVLPPFREIIRISTIVDLPEEAWSGVFLNNIMGTLFCSQAVGRHMRERRSGKIINVSSIAGITPWLPVLAPYAAAKAAVISLTRSMAIELAEYNVTVNAIAPGYIATAALYYSLGQIEDVLEPQIPIGRKGEPEDCAKVIEFLASDLSDYLTGAVIQADGGLFDLSPFVRGSAV